jgi:hypothetical protein
MTTPRCYHFYYNNVNVTTIVWLLLVAFIVIISPIPVNLAVVISQTKIILSNSAITLKVFYPNVLQIKYSLNLIVPNVAHSEIVDKNNRLNYQTTKCMVTWQALLAAKESTLHAAHPPLTCLPKRCVHIRDAEEVIMHLTMKTLRYRYGIGPTNVPCTAPLWGNPWSTHIL